MNDNKKVSKMFQRPFSFNGRIRRTEYCLSFLVYCIYYLSIRIIEGNATNEWFEIIWYLLFIPMLWFILAQGAKRCHDRDNSGWFQIIPFHALWMLFADSDQADNKYGEPPVAFMQIHFPKIYSCFFSFANGMVKLTSILNFIVLGLLLLIWVIAIFFERIAFGGGGGDVFYWFAFFVATIIHLLLTLIFEMKKQGAILQIVLHIILTVTFSTVLVLFVLQATIWRGGEYRWNGKIFFDSCWTVINIENNDTEKIVITKMCKNQYESQFVGTWDGKQMTIKEGEIQIPKRLEKHIKRPIAKVEITPLYHEFNKDSLKINQDYNLSGEVSAVRDYKPVILTKYLRIDDE